jgi:crotonobetainyl-CoA:carnitine CoA-transferase CaiB-like acyl-CoA transferase
MTVRNALGELLSLTGTEGEVAFEGEDPVFRTPYRIAAAGGAAFGAVGVAASRLFESRTGKKQRISVDLRAAAASLRSAYYLRVDGKPPKGPWDPLSGLYPVRDGRWVSVHCNFANHREAALQVLGTPPERAAAEAASRGWDGLALEEAIHAAGGCAGLARSAAEWAQHPHAKAVALQPLLSVEKIADSKPEPLPAGPRPLSKVRVLDLTRVLAGPTCARTLAEHGADVLKITGAHLPDSGPTEIDTGLGKLAAHLDLRSESKILRDLLRKADVFSQSYRPGALAARGFSPEDAAALRPGIVYVTLSAWGTTGPWAQRRGFDSIVQTVSGMALAQSGESKPKLMPVSAIDYVSGYLMAYGAMMALARRAREGGSWLVRVALASTGKWITDLGPVVGGGDDLSESEIKNLTEERQTPYGLVRHLKPVLQMSETQPRWERPPVPLGHNKPEWP